MKNIITTMIKDLISILILPGANLFTLASINETATNNFTDLIVSLNTS